MVKYLNFHNSSFALRYFLKKNVNGQGHSVIDTPHKGFPHGIRRVPGGYHKKKGLKIRGTAQSF
jgi:hypothetical protein